MLFHDRMDAGKQLAQELANYRNRKDVLVVGLPRGGVPVAGVVADALGAPLDIIVVRKLGVPWDPELGFGAIAEGGVRFLDHEFIRMSRLTGQDIDAIIDQQQHEIQRRQLVYRGGRTMENVMGKTVIVVDDGVATGGTMIAAVRAIREAGASRIIVAVPVGPETTLRILRREADTVVCLHIPKHFFAVGAWYRDFEQTTDEEVRAELSARGRTRETATEPNEWSASSGSCNPLINTGPEYRAL
ncbi:MAG: phosphoribosyltransferase [Bryobacteraceae bacterium]